MKPKTVFLGEMTNPEVEEFLKTNHTVIVPPGATEQHGPHAPLLTDVLIPNEIARRIASQVEALVAPPINYALSYPHAGFTGLVPIRIPTFMALIEDLCVGFATSGFKRIVFLNGHYDNTYAIAYACANVADKLSKDREGVSGQLLGRHDRGGCRRVDGAQERPPCKRRGDLRGARDQSAARRHGSRECRVPPFPEYTIANTGAVHTAFFFTSPGSVYWATVRCPGAMLADRLRKRRAMHRSGCALDAGSPGQHRAHVHPQCRRGSDGPCAGRQTAHSIWTGQGVSERYSRRHIGEEWLMDNRRTFLKSLAGLAAAASVSRGVAAMSQTPPGRAAPASAGRHSFRCCRAALVRGAVCARPRRRVRGIEMRTVVKDEEAAEIRDASKKTGRDPLGHERRTPGRAALER